MICADDRRLIARDHELPGLAVVLDGDAFVEALASALPGAAITRAEPTYVRYKPATSCVVAYEAQTAAGPARLYARAHRPEAPEKLRSAREAAERRSPLGPGGVVLEDLAIAVHSFPHDRRMGALRDLADDGRRSKILRRALPDQPALWRAELRTLRYKPERRWVARLSGGKGRDALLKLHAAAPQAAFQPHRLFSLAELGLELHAWIDGRALDDVLAAEQPGAVDAVGRGGRALAALHLAVPSARLPSAPLVDACHAGAEAIAALCPQLADRAWRVRDRLADLGHHAPVTVHGDFSIDQLVAAGPDAVTLIDFDAARRDDPTVDLGSFLADLEARVIRRELRGAVAAAAGGALLEGYRAAGGPAATGGPFLARHVAAALLLRAVEPFRRREAHWAAAICAHVRRAEQLLDAEGLATEALGATR